MQWSEAHPVTTQLFMGLDWFGNFHYHFASVSFEFIWMQLTKNNLVLDLVPSQEVKYAEHQRGISVIM